MQGSDFGFMLAFAPLPWYNMDILHRDFSPSVQSLKGVRNGTKTEKRGFHHRSCPAQLCGDGSD
jgi:hypothetical protein